MHSFNKKISSKSLELSKLTIGKLIAPVLLGVLMIPQLSLADNSPSTSSTTSPDLVDSLSCVVTAYYQPVPNQQNYLRGDFSAEVALDGDDTTADGSKVSVGTVAAPPQYPFGTIIDIAGFGVGQVKDRGGAIKGNRFDIWVGKGDEGLARATNWGKRTTNCVVYLPGSTVPDSVKSRIGTYNLPSAVLPPNYWQSKQSLGHKNLGIGDTGEDVTILTKTLKNLGYAVTVSDSFDTTVEQAVITFQTNKKIVASKDAFGAGVVGPKTWQALLSTDTVNVSPTDEVDVPFTSGSSATNNPSLSTNSTKVTTGSGNVMNLDLAYGAEGDEIGKLQENLRLLGYFDSPTITGYFGPATKAAIIRFQLAQKLIASADDSNAGNFDTATRKQMMAVLFGQTTTIPAPVLVLKKGSSGSEVSTLQEKLAKLGIYQGPITTYYGDQTAQAISDFQTKYKMTIDPASQGVYDNKTANRLDQALGLDISLSPAYTRYMEQFSLVNGVLK